ncbi:hemerythrin domain-containing protein [Anoxynatronum buryatiense]|uniref:Hemerythrin-like domain-containing protein n=1 Tax=Anoxynatronum buryatiense TaxID=489973 RepID=A0AA46AJM6_9CLOT|nr:hemerythrin domain-containing protein [Anoxynatronum buryatiense]SMP62711.1 Hemerythrin-like domain-containing protein [Anoxynatronum buryatiense]
MNAIELMTYEHTFIRRMLTVMRKFAYRLMNDPQMDVSDAPLMIDFVRQYADKHHHGKEEDLLFNRMVAHLGSAAVKLVQHGMLVEHDLGRLHMKLMEEGIEAFQAGDDEARLDIIGNAIAYTQLLDRHISKEDDMVYQFAWRHFQPEMIELINRETDDFEVKASAAGIQQHYLTLLEEMEAKYL